MRRFAPCLALLRRGFSTIRTTFNPYRPDVVVIGAGPAGALTALGEAQKGLSVTLVDARSAEEVLAPKGPCSYPIALNPKGLRAIEERDPTILEDLALVALEREWQVLHPPQGPPVPFRRVHPALAVTRGDMARVVHDRLACFENVQRRFDWPVDDILATHLLEHSRLRVTSPAGPDLSCSHAVVADGRHSPNRGRLLAREGRLGEVERILADMAMVLFHLHPGELAEADPSLDPRALHNFQMRPHGAGAMFGTVSPNPDSSAAVTVVTTKADWEAHPALAPPPRDLALYSGAPAGTFCVGLVRALARAGNGCFARILDHAHDGVAFARMEGLRLANASAMDGRVVFVGDAAYAEPPINGVGANVAACSASALVRLQGPRRTHPTLSRAFSLFGAHWLAQAKAYAGHG